MLDYGFRSRCCKAPLRLGKVKKNSILKQVWVCTQCRKSGVDIIPTSEFNSQVTFGKDRPFSDES